MAQEIDFEKLMSLVQGSRELLEQLLNTAVTDWNLQQEQLAQAVRAQDFDQVRKRIHRIKGAVKNFYHQRLVDWLQVFESAAERGEPQDWAAFLKELNQDLKKLEADVRAYL